MQRPFVRLSVEYGQAVKTRRQPFLARMAGLVPWAELEQRDAPVAEAEAGDGPYQGG